MCPVGNEHHVVSHLVIVITKGGPGSHFPHTQRYKKLVKSFLCLRIKVMRIPDLSAKFILQSQATEPTKLESNL